MFAARHPERFRVVARCLNASTKTVTSPNRAIGGVQMWILFWRRGAVGL